MLPARPFICAHGREYVVADGEQQEDIEDGQNPAPLEPRPHARWALSRAGRLGGVIKRLVAEQRLLLVVGVDYVHRHRRHARTLAPLERGERMACSQSAHGSRAWQGARARSAPAGPRGGEQRTFKFLPELVTMAVYYSTYPHQACRPLE